MWAATPFRPQLAFDATDGGGFLGHMVWTVHDDGTIKVKAPRDKLTLNFKHLNLDFWLITDEATSEKKLKVDMWAARKQPPPHHCITKLPWAEEGMRNLLQFFMTELGTFKDGDLLGKWGCGVVRDFSLFK
ncbi:60S ribosomal protein L9, partial [Striga asiatica]